jgi:hypothetical protein
VREEEGALLFANCARDNRGGNDRFATAGRQHHQDALAAASDRCANGGDTAVLVGAQLRNGRGRWY